MVTFAELISGKRVAFIGPSPYLLSQCNGSFFDSFDVVVRTNGAFPVKEELAADYGTKCDVLYINASFAKIIDPLPVQDYKVAGLQFLVFKVLTAEKMQDYNSVIASRTLDPRCKVWTHPGTPVMGILLLRDLLLFNPKSIFIAGIDFFSVPEHHYFAGYQPKRILDAVPADNREKLNCSNAIHDYESNKNEMKKILLENDKITVDQTIQELLTRI